MELEQAVAETVRAARMKRGMSQRRLALRAGMPPSYVNSVEGQKRSPTLRTLLRLAAALETSGANLLRNIERRCGPEGQAADGAGDASSL